jgi:hypothetical protein
MGWMQFVISMWAPFMGMLSAATWPAALLLAVWWARPLLLRTAETLTQLIRERDWKVKLGGFEASVQQVAQAELIAGILEPTDELGLPPEDSSKKSINEPLPPSSGELAARFEQEAAKTLEHLGPEQGPPAIARAHGELRAQLVFEYIFNRIFKSQVDLLQLLNMSGGTVTTAEVQRHYADVQVVHSQFLKPEGMAQWLRYLEVYELVRWEGADLHLTSIGREFLIYLVKAGLNPDSRGL